MVTNAFKLIEQFVANRNSPGAVALIGHQDKLYGPYAFGHTSFFPQATTVKDDTIYDLASLTKVISTTTAVLMLLEQGLVRLDDTLGYFWPHIPSDKKGITLKQLLTHTSGLPAWAALYEMANEPSEVITAIMQQPLSYPGGTKVEYSCLGFIVLGHLVEYLTDQYLREFAHQQIFVPLGMNSTFYTPNVDVLARIAYTEWCPRKREFLRGVVHDENAQAMQGISGNAGLFSTAMDLANFCQMILNGGQFNSRQLLSSNTIRLLTENFTPGLNDKRTLGWLLKSDNYCSGGDLISPRSIGHTGFTGTSIWIDPQIHGFFILLTNRVHPTRENAEIIRLRPLFHNTAIASLTC